MIPWLIAGAVGAIIADEIISDDVLKKDIKEEKKVEESSRDEASQYLSPEEIAKIEGGSSNISSSSPSAKVFYEAENYFYGRNRATIN